MSYLEYAGMKCDCPKCGNKPSFDFPICHIHIRWSNQHGAAIRIFCENCRHAHDMCNVSGSIIFGLSYRIEGSMYNWKSRDWKIERLAYLEGIKAKFKISYRGRPDVYEKFDEEMAILENHLR